MPTTDRQLLLLGMEVAYGSDPDLDGTNALLVTDLAYKLENGLYRTPSSSPLQRAMIPATVGNRRPSLDFKAALRGNTSALGAGTYPANHLLLQMAGMVGAYSAGPPKTWTYGWSPDQAISCWAEFYNDGLLQAVGGLRADMDFEIVAGQPLVQAVKGKGIYVPVDDAVMPTPTHNIAPPLLCEGIEFRPFGDTILDGAFGRISKATLNFRNELFQHDDFNAAEGVAGIQLTRRGSGDDAGPKVILEGTRPGGTDSARWWNRFLARTESAACTAVFGSALTGLKQTFTISFGRLVVDQIEDTVNGSVLGFKATCSILGTAAGTTEDDLVMAWKQYT